MGKERNLNKKVLSQILNNSTLKKSFRQKIIKAKGKPFTFIFQGRTLEIKQNT